MAVSEISELLGPGAQGLLNHECKTIGKDLLHLPGPDFIDRIFSSTNRPNQVLVNLNQLYNHGRLSGTGYLSIVLHS